MTNIIRSLTIPPAVSAPKLIPVASQAPPAPSSDPIKPPPKDDEKSENSAKVARTAKSVRISSVVNRKGSGGSLGKDKRGKPPPKQSKLAFDDVVDVKMDKKTE